MPRRARAAREWSKSTSTTRVIGILAALDAVSTRTGASAGRNRARLAQRAARHGGTDRVGDHGRAGQGAGARRAADAERRRPQGADRGREVKLPALALGAAARGAGGGAGGRLALFAVPGRRRPRGARLLGGIDAREPHLPRGALRGRLLGRAACRDDARGRRCRPVAGADRRPGAPRSPRSQFRTRPTARRSRATSRRSSTAIKNGGEGFVEPIDGAETSSRALPLEGSLYAINQALFFCAPAAEEPEATAPTMRPELVAPGAGASADEVAAVDRQDRAGDEAGERRAEKERGTGEVLGRAPAAQSACAPSVRRCARRWRAAPRSSPSRSSPGAMRVDADVVLGAGDGQRLGQLRDAALARGIGRGMRGAEEREHRADVEDGAAAAASLSRKA